jgi:hypothetical protein
MIFPEDTERCSHPDGADVPGWGVPALFAGLLAVVGAVVVLVLTLH